MNLKIVCQKENELLELRKNLKSELKKINIRVLK